MRFKKGFTLAEILIVLMVIGALATMTVPSLMKGVTEAQFKTAYRKGLNAIVNLTTMEKLSGNLPARTIDPAGTDKLFDLLKGSLSVKAYVPTTGGGILNSGTTIDTKDYINDATNAKNWIVTEDNLAYLVEPSSNTAASCGTKTEILGAQDSIAPAATVPSSGKTDAHGASGCYVIWVDVNGLSAGPNQTHNNGVKNDAKVGAITWDQFPIYVGKDGATAGNQKTTITGRIAADLK